MSKISCKFYDPSTIFDKTEPSKGMRGPNNMALAEAFYLSRTKAINDYNQTSDARNFVRNAGAVQLFDIKGIDSKGSPGKAMSISIKNADSQLTSLGHSERILMRDVLEEFISANQSASEFLPPSERSRSGEVRDEKYEILYQLNREASEYQSYLTDRNTIVKMWSELTACDYDLKGPEGEQCINFINNIFPTNSKYGYIANDKRYKEDAFRKFNDAHINYSLNKLNINTESKDVNQSDSKELTESIIESEGTNNPKSKNIDKSANHINSQDTSPKKPTAGAAAEEPITTQENITLKSAMKSTSISAADSKNKDVNKSANSTSHKITSHKAPEKITEQVISEDGIEQYKITDSNLFIGQEQESDEVSSTGESDNSDNDY